MWDKVTLWATLCCFIAPAITERPPETILASDSYKPKVLLSLLAPEHPHEGDEVQLECSAKPKNRSASSKPDNVHWIKGNVGVPDAGTRPEADRYVKETTTNEKGVVLFTLTIKEAEPSDTDKYMCIVQVGKTGYFTSNELQVDIEPSLEEKKNDDVSVGTDEVDDIDEILKWKDRVLDLSQDELKKLADAMTIDAERKKAAEERGDDEDIPQKDDTVLLTKKERDILARKNEIEDMSESEIMLLAQAMRKEKTIKAQQEEQERERKKQEEELKITAKNDAEKKKSSDTLSLNAEEKNILKRKDEIADMTEDDLKLLSAAMKKERSIKQQREEKDSNKASGNSDDELTEEERQILKRKSEIKTMSKEELKIMSRAVTKQKKIQDAKKKLDPKTEDADSAIKTSPKATDDDDMTEEEMNAILAKRDNLSDLTQDDLNLLTKALTKEKKLKEARRKRGIKPEDEMTDKQMREYLKLRQGDMSKLTQKEITLLGKAMLREKKMKEQQKTNDPLEEEEFDLRDEL